MGFDTSIFRHEKVQPLQPMNALMQGLQLQGAQQGNALQQMQLQYLQQEKALALQKAREDAAMRTSQQNALMQMPSPQMEARQQALAGGGGPTMANAARMPQVDPRMQALHGLTQAGLMPIGEYVKQRYPAPDLKAVGMDQNIVDMNAFGAPVVRPGTVRPAAKPSAVQEFEYGQQNPAFNEWSLRGKKAGATNVSIGAPLQENEFKKGQGKEFSEVMGAINKAGFEAPIKLRRLERMEQLLQGVDGGKLTPVGLEVASWANSVGIKIDPRAGNKEAGQALAREMAATFRQPGTGPMTDKDFDNFLLQVPDLSKTAEGRKQITATMRAAANRDIAISKMAREYVRKNGQLDNAFYDEAAMFMAENPVVGSPDNWRVVR